jgi:thioredoxin reductase
MFQIGTAEKSMERITDVAVIGAGPYGLSLAAHLEARGVEFRIFGRALETWRRHMPRNMDLKSDGFASNLSAPAPDSTLKAYCARHGIRYGDQGLPVALDTFLSYAGAFQERFVPRLEQQNVARLSRGAGGFTVTLDDGERFAARNVVLAVGISWFAYTPPMLAQFSPDLVSHSFAHRDADRFKGKDVAVIGAGASAIDLASLLHETGANVRVIARTRAVDYNPVPDAAAETFFYRVMRPASGIGRGWKSYFCAQAPLLFYRLPAHLKQRAIRSHMHPAAGWFMRAKSEGRIPMLLGREIVNAEARDGRVALTLVDHLGNGETHGFDHVIAATGYRTDMRKLPFLAPELRARISIGGTKPNVSDNFETDVPGLYATGMAAMESFGPLLRFMVGAEFAAPRLASHLEKKTLQPARKRTAAAA